MPDAEHSSTAVPDAAIRRRGAMAVVLAPERDRVLLLRREVVVLWDLPGGGVEPGESAAAAAERETMEETGYVVEVEREVGRYVHQSVYGPGFQETRAFAARAVGGKPRRIGLETTGLNWCRVDALPRVLPLLQRQMIADALAGGSAPVDRRIDFPPVPLAVARVVFTVLRLANATIRGIGRMIRAAMRN